MYTKHRSCLKPPSITTLKPLQQTALTYTHNPTAIQLLQSSREPFFYPLIPHSFPYFSRKPHISSHCQFFFLCRFIPLAVKMKNLSISKECGGAFERVQVKGASDGLNTGLRASMPINEKLVKIEKKQKKKNEEFFMNFKAFFLTLALSAWYESAP